MFAQRSMPRIQLSWIVTFCTILFLVGPFIVVFGASFDSAGSYHVSFPPRSFSLQWYQSISSKYLHAAWISFVVGLVVAALATVIGIAASLGLVRGNIVGRQALQAFFRLPVQIPLVVTGAVFLQFYYQLLALTGWNLLSSIWGLVIAHVFAAIPYCVGSVSSVLVRVDPQIEEAAHSLGATSWSTFWRVTFPLMRPGVAAGMFYAFIISFGDVPIAIFLVDAAHMTLPVQMFQDMQFDFQPSMLAVSTLVVIASGVAIVLVQRFAGLDLVLPSRRK